MGARSRNSSRQAINSKNGWGSSVLLFMFLLIPLLLSVSSPASGQSDPYGPPPPDAADLALPDPASDGEKPLPNMSTAVSKLYTTWQSDEHLHELPDGLSIPEVVGDRVMVMLIMLNEASAQQTIASLPELGAEVIAHHAIWIDARVPVPALEQVAALPGISLVREPVELFPVDPIPSDGGIGSNLLDSMRLAPTSTLARTQGVNASGASAWHSAGWTGRGVKVAVMDVGFYGYRDAQAHRVVSDFGTEPSQLPFGYFSEFADDPFA